MLGCLRRDGVSKMWWLSYYFLDLSLRMPVTTRIIIVCRESYENLVFGDVKEERVPGTYDIFL